MMKESMKDSQSNKHNHESRSNRKLAIGVAMGSVAATGLVALGIEAANSSNHLQRDLPSTIVNTGMYTPTATDTRYFVTVEENLPGPAFIPGNGKHIEVTLVVPEDKADLYHKGQSLSPDHTNELIDSAIG